MGSTKGEKKKPCSSSYSGLVRSQSCISLGLAHQDLQQFRLCNSIIERIQKKKALSGAAFCALDLYRRQLNRLLKRLPTAHRTKFTSPAGDGMDILYAIRCI